MRYLIILSLLHAIAHPAWGQFTPGNVVVGDEDGTLYEVTPVGVATTVVKLRPPVWGLDFDAGGDLLVGGIGALWRVDRGGKVATVFDGLHFYNIGDVEVNASGNVYLTSMGNNFIYEMDPVMKTVVNVYPLPGATRAWGMGIDPRSGMLYVTALTRVFTVDPGRNKVTQIHSGPAGSFYQGGTFGFTGRFAFTDEFRAALHEIDGQGVLTTLIQGLPLVDPGEGVTLDQSGDYLFTDDGAIAGPTSNRVFQVRPGSPAVLTTLSMSPTFSDVNGLASVPGLFLSNLSPQVRIGNTALIGVGSVDAPLEPYAFAASLSTRYGIPLPGGRRFPLDFDNLLVATAKNLLSMNFQNYHGVLDIVGTATLKIVVPRDSGLIGISVFTAGLTLNLNAPGTIHLISSAVKTEIVQ